MGWTFQRAGYYKGKNIDRKAECDALWNNDGCFMVEKSAMVGSTYYAAIRITGKRIQGEIRELPKQEQRVFAAIFLTSLNNKDYCNFGYKDMDETVHPYYYDCPISILNLLSKTDNKNANEWRNECRKQIAKKRADKSNPDSLENLPIGSIISCKDIHGAECQLIKTAPMAQFKTPFWKVKGEWTYFQKKYIKNHGYTVIKRV